MNNELYHHGVSGMKWGKRNGPPYPLNAEGKADLRAQKKAAKIGSTEGTSDSRAQKKAARAENKELASQVKKSQVYKNNKMMNHMRAKKRVHRDTAIGGLASAAVGFAAGGPVGAAAGIIGGALVSSIASSTVNKGRQIYENSKFKNMKVSELKEKKENAKEYAKKSEAQVLKEYKDFQNFEKEIQQEWDKEHNISKSQRKEINKANREMDDFYRRKRENTFSTEQNGSGLDKFEMRRAKRYEKIAKKENIKIDPNDPRRDTYEKAVITKRNGWNKENTFTPERQKSMLNTAKTQDKYDLTFLEMVQNTSFENMSKTEFKKKYGRDPKTVRLEAYKEYLKNPEDFIDNRLVKWDNW